MKKLSLPFIAFLQSSGLFAYIILVSSIMINAESWFSEGDNVYGPILFLSLFVTSALVSSLTVLGYPFLLFWDKKNPRAAIKLVAMTCGWLVFFISLVLLVITIY